MSNTRDTLGEQATLDGLIAHTLTNFEDDEVTTIGSYALYKNIGLQTITLPSVTTINSNGLDSCTNLTTVDISGRCTINSSAFNGCSKMDAILLRNTTDTSTLSNTSAFTGTKIASGFGGIYVPSTLLSTYKSASNWSTFASNIYPLTEYPKSEFGTISDSWSTIISNCKSGNTSGYNIGDTKQMTINGVDFFVEIVAKDTDQLSDDTGTASLTWMVKDFYTTHNMNNSNTNTNGWEASVMRNWLRSNVITALPAELQAGIKEVKKTYYDKTSSSTKTCNDTIWIPSTYEMYSDASSYRKESSGVQYTKFNSNTKRIKKNVTTGSANSYWLRSAYDDKTNFYSVNNYGSPTNYYASVNVGVIWGFCIGASPLVRFLNDDGTVLQQSRVTYGSDASYTGSTPTKAATAQYTYTFSGWDKALTNITDDTDITAQYTSTTNTYTVTFKNDDNTTVLQTSTVAYGSTPSYTGTTPTTTNSNTYGSFLGWTPAIGPITGTTTYVATYEQLVSDTEISGTWNDIINSVIYGTYGSYKPGNYKALDLGTEGTIDMQIVAKDEDTDAEGGTAPLTFIAKQLLNTDHNMNSSSTTTGGYSASAMKTYMNSTILGLIPSTVKSHLKVVTKTSRDYNGGSQRDLITNEKVWIPSYREIFGGTSNEQTGVIYNIIYKDSASRKKAKAGGSAYDWWLRSAQNAGRFSCVTGYGSSYDYSANTSIGVALGFCVGPDTIQDTWEEISAAISDGTYTTKYAIGDTKAVDMGDQGIICMQIAAFNADADANSNTAPITWVSQQILPTQHNMNSSAVITGGYPASAMKTYIATLKSKLPATVQSMLMSVQKTSRDFNSGNSQDLITTEELWIPSYREAFGGTNSEQTGAVYSGLFNSNANRIKKRYGTGSANGWWLRSTYYGSKFRRVDSGGITSDNDANSSNGVVLGFCTGAIPTSYGVEWDYSQSATALTRTGDASSFSNPAPATALDGTGTSPFDNIYPWSGMKRYNVVSGTLVPDTDPSFSETSYDTVVYIPEFYYKAEKDTTNSKWNWAISPTPRSGYAKHPGSGCYVGRFHTSGDSSAVFSKSGVTPLDNVTRANFRTYSAAKGTGWRQIDLKTWSAIQMLYLVEFADWNSQDALGAGQNTSSVTSTGATTGAAYHTIKRSGASNTYHWIENPFSNVYTWVDGFVASSRNSYIATDPANYGDTTSGMEAAGITLPSSEFITGLGYSEKCAWAFIPDTASGGSANTKIPDKVFSGSGALVLLVGGNYNALDYFGLFFFNANYKASETYAGVGSRLLYQPSSV